MRAFERIVRLSLRAYTPDFRKRYGDEITETILERAREVVRSSGWMAAASLGARELLGIVSMGVRARLVRRVALGARRGSVMALVFGSGPRPVLLVMAGGIVAAGLLARAMSTFLYEVKPVDPVTFAFVGAIVLIAALTACAIPARWATHVDPSAALKME